MNNDISHIKLTDEQQVIRNLSDRVVAAQGPIRILDAIKWSTDVRQAFFDNKCEKQPPVDADFYLKRPLGYDIAEKQLEFKTIIRDAKNQLGQYSMISQLIEKRCTDYMRALTMLDLRGKPEFGNIVKELYGSPDDVFYLGGPNLSELGQMLGDMLKGLIANTPNFQDNKIYTAEQARDILQERLNGYFSNKAIANRVYVSVSDDIVSDASAGADNIKIKSNLMFSDRDLRYLEVHEGWVHIGTTLNGALQPICTFLSKGSPASSVTQEGLAVLTEMITFSSFPIRLLKITNRVRCIDMVNQGATFIDIFRFLKGENYSEMEAYNYAVRVFRGSTPTGGAFTKDLSYTKGFILIYNYMRLAVQEGLLRYIPFFFCGKTLIEEVGQLADLHKQELVMSPVYIPDQFKDLATLTSWMCFSLFLNKFDLDKLGRQYQLLR